MTKVLLVAEHDGVTINPSTAKCVSCAGELPDAEIDIIVFADDGADIAKQAAAISGIAKVIQVDKPVNANPVAAILAPQVAALADGYSHLLGPSTTFEIGRAHV